jgi:hypothetical protein
MLKVVDSNQLQSECLRSYLAGSNANFAVLTDYAAMEAYKGDTLVSIYKSMEIVAEFPTQVIVLKNTRIACSLSGKCSNLQRRLIDERQTQEFKIYARSLRETTRGNPSLQRQILEYGKEATEHLERMLDDARTTGAVFDEIAKAYTKEERGLIRDGKIYTPALADKIVKNVLYIAGELFRNHPDVQRLPTYEELPDTFIFRAALCTYLLALERGALGGANSTSPAKLRNDMVDMNFAAYGTFFDGLLSADARVLRIHEQACLFLAGLFGCRVNVGLT